MLSENLQFLLKTIKTGNEYPFREFTDVIEKFTSDIGKDIISELSDSLEFGKLKDKREKCYYLALSFLLLRMNFAVFRKVFNHSDKLGFFIEVKKIPFRFKILAILHLQGMGRGLTGRIFEIIKHFNKYNLFERNFTKDHIKIIEDVKKNDILFVANLKDLFGSVSDSLIYYLCKIMPYDLYLRRIIPRGLEGWLNNYYSMYGLIARNIGPIEKFLEKIGKTHIPIKNFNQNQEENFISYGKVYYENGNIRDIIHAVYPENVLKCKDDILKKDNYKFYSLSMVLLGGLGPEGFGFTYSTPRGEVIEICSDQKQSEAIIIKFKQYLKNKFLSKLEEEMADLGIEARIIEKIIAFLSEILDPKTLISYQNRDKLMEKIKNFIYQIEEFREQNKNILEEIINRISIAVSVILRKIRLKEQFKTRMDLVTQDKIRSEDIAKLTKKFYYDNYNRLICFACGTHFNKTAESCPKCKASTGKSHYDLLRERMFFQNEIKWYTKDYSEEMQYLEEEYFLERERVLNGRGEIYSDEANP